MSGQVFSLEEFEAQLAYVLQHLYDPALRPPELVARVIGLTAYNQLDVLQTAMIQAVEDLRPADYVPRSARSWRFYGILYYRFVSNLAQEEVAERVSITPRHLRREQAAAIHLLALKLMETARLPLPEEEPEGEESAPEGAPEPVDAELQLKNDLMALQESAPGVSSDVIQVIRSVLALLERLPDGKKLKIEQILLPEELKGALHPSALRQVLWMILHRGITCLEAASLSIRAGVHGSRAFIDLVFTPGFAFGDAQQQMIEEILLVQNGTLQIIEEGNTVTFRVEILHVNRTVLVVDDNPEIVHLYQRYLVGTPYHLIHIAKGQELFAQIDPIRPDLIVLDIMLPDVDGWDLLTRLSELPETRDIPVVVCSVVNDTDLAMALGAFACLTKPVRRPDFIRALDQATAQA